MLATTLEPGGAAVTVSPWLIHTTWSSGRSRNSTLPSGWARRLVRPYSLTPVASTRPPRALGHGLLAVAEPEHRDAQLEQARVEGGRARLVDRLGAAGEDQGLGVVGPDRRRVDVAGDDLGEDVALADAAGDELGVLGAEVEHQDGVVAGGRSRHGRRITNSRNRLLARLAQEYRGAERGSRRPLVPRPRTTHRTPGVWCVFVSLARRATVTEPEESPTAGPTSRRPGRRPDPAAGTRRRPGGALVRVGPDLRRRRLPDPAVALQPRQLLLGPPGLGPPGGHPPPPRRGRRGRSP